LIDEGGSKQWNYESKVNFIFIFLRYI
jgi:hypothetical protein